MTDHRLSEWLDRIDQVIWQEVELQPILDVVVDAVRDLTGANDADILLIKGKSLHLEAYTRPWEGGTVIDVLEGDRGVINWVASTCKSALVNDVGSEEPWRTIYVPGLRDICSELTVPIVGKANKLLGIINLEHTECDAFNEEHQEQIEGIARQVAIAIDRARQYEELKRAHRELDALYQLEQKYLLHLFRGEGQVIDEQVIYEEMLETATTLVGADCGDLVLYDPAQDLLRVIASTDPDLAVGFTQKLGEGIVGKAAQENITYRIPDVQSNQYRRHFKELWARTRSELAVPMRDDQERLVGVINLESEQVDKFREADEVFLRLLANHVLLLIGQLATAYRLEALLAISRMAITEREPEQVVAGILRQALRLANGTLADIVHYDAQEQVCGGWAAIYRGDERQFRDQDVEVYVIPKERFPVYSGGIMAQVARTGKPYVTGDTEADPFYQPDPYQPLVRSELAVPMLSEAGRVIGVLNVESPDRNAFSTGDSDVFAAFANQVASVLRLAEERKQREQERSLIEGARLLVNLGHRLGNELGRWPDKLKRMSKAAAQLGHEPLQGELLQASAAIGQATRLVGAIKEAAQMRQSAVETAPQRVRVADLVGTVLELYEMAGYRRPEIRNMVPDSGDLEVWVPREPTIDAIGHVYMNAVQVLADQDNGVIVFEAERVGEEVVLSIRDNGPGIPPGHRPHVFEFGYTTRKDQGGSGYGLWSARGAIEACGGTIGLDETSAVGAAFAITLPAEAG